MRVPFDLHMHSCLSPCGSEDNTPANLAAMCSLAGLKVVALTDHNTTRNCASFCKAAARYDLLALPGMELTTQEEVHVVCLLPTLEGAEEMCRYVYDRLPQVPYRPEYFGEQFLMDDGDRILGQDTAFLSGSTSIGIYDVPGLVDRWGGVSFPAHIDRPSFSLLSNLGIWDDGMGFHTAERAYKSTPDFFPIPDLPGVRIIANCDAHYLDQIPDAHQYMDIPELTPGAVIQWLKEGSPG